MPVIARSVYDTDINSHEAGLSCARALLERIGATPAVALTYLTVNHDQAAFLRGLRDVLGAGTCILGCSGQGVMGSGVVREEGYAAGVMGLGAIGAPVVGARVEDIQVDTAAKGRALGRAIVQRLGQTPRVAVLHYDPLCGVDMDLFLAGLDEVLGCPIVGGGAGHIYGPMRTTFQYFNDEVTSCAAVAVGLAGDFTAELAITIGCSPVGIEMTVTRAQGNNVLELDGRPALDVWKEITGAGAPDLDHTAALALGVVRGGSEGSGEYLIRSAFGVDHARGGVILQAGIPEGTQVMLHHRTVSDILEGSARMGEELGRRLRGKTVRAVLGFECGARTLPFLGMEAARKENLLLQQAVGRDAEWLGLLAWGEIYPVGGRTAFHNYTYPVLAIAD